MQLFIFKTPSCMPLCPMSITDSGFISFNTILPCSYKYCELLTKAHVTVPQKRDGSLQTIPPLHYWYRHLNLLCSISDHSHTVNSIVSRVDYFLHNIIFFLLLWYVSYHCLHCSLHSASPSQWTACLPAFEMKAVTIEDNLFHLKTWLNCSRTFIFPCSY
jgi:hypothetical protein